MLKSAKRQIQSCMQLKFQIIWMGPVSANYRNTRAWRQLHIANCNFARFSFFVWCLPDVNCMKMICKFNKSSARVCVWDCLVNKCILDIYIEIKFVNI